MSFLPYGPASGSAWFASISGSTAIHGAVVLGLLTSSVALLPEQTTPAVREPEYEITLEIVDADIIDLDDEVDSRAIPEDAEALAPDEAIADTLDEVGDVLTPEDGALAPEEDLLTPQDDALAPEEDLLAPEDEALAADLPEPEVLAPEAPAPLPEDAPEAQVPDPMEEAIAAPIAPEPPAPDLFEEDFAAPDPLPAPEPLQEDLALLGPETDVLAPEVVPEPVPDPDDLSIDDLGLIDETILNPLAESVAPSAPETEPLAPVVIEPEVVDLAPEPAAPDTVPELAGDDIAILIQPEPVLPEVAEDPVQETALPLAPEPEPALPEIQPEPEAEPAAPEIQPDPETVPDVSETPDPPADTDTAQDPDATARSGAAIANPSAGALQIGTLLRRIRLAPAPQCTLALPRRAGADSVGVSFIGAVQDDLDDLAARVLDGLEPAPAQTREILDPRQCAALDAIRLSSAYPASRIGLALEDSTLSSGDSLRVRVLGADGLNLSLVVVDDNGVVQDLARFTELDGNVPVIDAPVARSGPARDTRQVLIVMGSPDAPIDLSGNIGRLAQDVFAGLPRAQLETMVFGLATFDVR